MKCNIVIFIFFFISFYANGQEDPFRFDWSKRNYTRITTRKGGASRDPKPDVNSKRFKFHLEMPYDTTYFSLYIEDYKKGEKVHDQDELVNYGMFPKGTSINFELVPDLSKINGLHLFFYFQGMTLYRYKFAAENNKLDYACYNQERKPMFKDGKVLFVIYETDKDNYKKIITSPKVDLNNYLLEIDRCIIVYYKCK